MVRKSGEKKKRRRKWTGRDSRSVQIPTIGTVNDSGKETIRGNIEHFSGGGEKRFTIGNKDQNNNCLEKGKRGIVRGGTTESRKAR